MRFCLTKVNTFTRKVVFGVPEGDSFQSVVLKGTFRIGVEESLREGLRSNRELLDAHLVAVDGLEDEAGAAITGEAAIHLVKRHDVAAVAFAKEYINALNEGADRKN